MCPFMRVSDGVAEPALVAVQVVTVVPAQFGAIPGIPPFVTTVRVPLAVPAVLRVPVAPTLLPKGEKSGAEMVKEFPERANPDG